MYLQSALENGFCSVRIRGPLDEARLRRSLERLPRRHPLLGARVVLKQGVHTFTTEGVPPLPLRVTSGDGSAQSFSRVVFEELFTPLTRPTGPLARFTLVRHSEGERADLMIAVDHTIADASACLYAIRDLLTFDSAPELESEPTALPPPCSHLLPAALIDAESLSVPSLDAHSPSTPTLAASTPDNSIDLAVLPCEPFRALAQRCREQSTTVHAALCVAFAEAFAALSGDKPAVTISSPVSLRPRLDPSVREAFSCSIAFTQVHVARAPPGSFWEQARAVRQQFMEGTTDSQLFGSLGMIEGANKAERDDSQFLHRARQRLQRMERHDLSISNLGRQPISSRYGELTIEAIHSGAALPGEVVITLFTVDDTMHVTLLARRPSRAENDAARQMLALALSRLSTLPS